MSSNIPIISHEHIPYSQHRICGDTHALQFSVCAAPPASRAFPILFPEETGNRARGSFLKEHCTRSPGHSSHVGTSETHPEKHWFQLTLCINCLVPKKCLLWAHFIAMFLSSSEADHLFGHFIFLLSTPAPHFIHGNWPIIARWCNTRKTSIDKSVLKHVLSSVLCLRAVSQSYDYDAAWTSSLWKTNKETCVWIWIEGKI